MICFFYYKNNKIIKYSQKLFANVLIFIMYMLYVKMLFFYILI